MDFTWLSISNVFPHKKTQWFIVPIDNISMSIACVCLKVYVFTKILRFLFMAGSLSVQYLLLSWIFQMVMIQIWFIMNNLSFGWSSNSFRWRNYAYFQFYAMLWSKFGHMFGKMKIVWVNQVLIWNLMFYGACNLNGTHPICKSKVTSFFRLMLEC